MLAMKNHPRDNPSNFPKHHYLHPQPSVPPGQTPMDPNFQPHPLHNPLHNPQQNHLPPHSIPVGPHATTLPPLGLVASGPVSTSIPSVQIPLSTGANGAGASEPHRMSMPTQHVYPQPISSQLPSPQHQPPVPASGVQPLPYLPNIASSNNAYVHIPPANSGVGQYQYQPTQHSPDLHHNQVNIINNGNNVHPAENYQLIHEPRMPRTPKTMTPVVGHIQTAPPPLAPGQPSQPVYIHPGMQPGLQAMGPPTIGAPMGPIPLHNHPQYQQHAHQPVQGQTAQIPQAQHPAHQVAQHPVAQMQLQAAVQQGMPYYLPYYISPGQYPTQMHQPQYVPTRQFKSRKKLKHLTIWTGKEDRLLRKLKEVQKLGWREMLSYFEDRTPNACQFRWRRLVSGTTEKDKFNSADGSTEPLESAEEKDYIHSEGNSIETREKEENYANSNSTVNGNSTSTSSFTTPAPNDTATATATATATTSGSMTPAPVEQSEVKYESVSPSINHNQHQVEAIDENTSNPISNSNSNSVNKSGISPNESLSPQDVTLSVDEDAKHLVNFLLN